jgi:hypothetical protein
MSLMSRSRQWSQQPTHMMCGLVCSAACQLLPHGRVVCHHHHVLTGPTSSIFTDSTLASQVASSPSAACEPVAMQPRQDQHHIEQGCPAVSVQPSPQKQQLVRAACCMMSARLRHTSVRSPAVSYANDTHLGLATWTRSGRPQHCVLEGLRRSGVEGPAIVHETVSEGVVSSFGKAGGPMSEYAVGLAPLELFRLNSCLTSSTPARTLHPQCDGPDGPAGGTQWSSSSSYRSSCSSRQKMTHA